MELTHRITRGHLVRHVPPRSGIGMEVALLDIAQDFLPAGLHRAGLFDGLIVFKGGTALRKHFAGNTGRFSTDCDFPVASMDLDRAEVADTVAHTIASLDPEPFQYAVEKQRDRWQPWTTRSARTSTERQGGSHAEGAGTTTHLVA